MPGTCTDATCRLGTSRELRISPSGTPHLGLPSSGVVMLVPGTYQVAEVAIVGGLALASLPRFAQEE